MKPLAPKDSRAAVQSSVPVTEVPSEDFRVLGLRGSRFRV